MGKPLRRPFVLALSLLLLGWAGCDGGKGAAPGTGGAAGTAGAAGSGGPAPAASAVSEETPGAGSEGNAEEAAVASTLRFRFDPPFADASDVAVGERRQYRVRLVAEGEGEIPNASLVSGCDCLSAEFATPLTRDGAEVDVYIQGHQDEDIEGVLWLEGPGREQLAEHNVKILIQWKPFVSPREVNLTEASRSFKIGVYVATPPGEPEAEFVFEDAPLDDATPYHMIDYQTPEELTVDYLLRGHELTFEVPLDRVEGFEYRQILKLAEPALTFEVPVRFRVEEGD